MESRLEIVPMTERALDLVLSIQAVCYTEIAPESRESLRSKLVASPSTCFVAVSFGSVVGYLIALPWIFESPPGLNQEWCELPSKPDCLYLHDLAVSPTSRGVGAGRALVDAFFIELEELQLSRAALIAVQGAGAYWERFGFQPAEVRSESLEKLRGYGERALYMECKR